MFCCVFSRINPCEKKDNEETVDELLEVGQEIRDAKDQANKARDPETDFLVDDNEDEANPYPEAQVSGTSSFLFIVRSLKSVGFVSFLLFPFCHGVS